jgi:hypothetical protein
MHSNRPIEEWGKLLSDVPAAGAILDRLLHHAELIAISGRSYRLQRNAKPSPVPNNTSPPLPAVALRLQRVQAQIRHKRGPPTGYPHLFRFELELASAPRCKGGHILSLIYCSLVPRSHKIKNKTLNTCRKTYLKYVANCPAYAASQIIHEPFLAKIPSVDLNVKSGRF